MWFYAAILFVPIGIPLIFVAPTSLLAYLIASAGIIALVNAVRLSTQKVITTNDALVFKTLAQTTSFDWLDVQSLRFATIHERYGNYGVAVFVETPRAISHFIVPEKNINAVKKDMIPRCKNAIIIDDDAWTLNPPRNPSARSHQRLRRYARGMILRRTIPNALSTAVLVFILAAFGMDLSQRHNIPKSIAAPIITIVGVIAFTIFAVSEYRFARRLLR
jgi:hypothetical protein